MKALSKLLFSRFLITIFLLPIISLHAFGEGNAGVIKGSVENIKEEVIEYANVSLHHVKDSSLVTGTTSDEHGNFELSGVAEGNYLIKLSYVGYKDKWVKDVSVTGEAPAVDLGKILMDLGTLELAEMIVGGEKNVMQTKLDKKIFNASKSLVSQGGDALDVLRNIPSVDVDVDDQISLRGDQNVIVLIDGRRSAMPASQYLKMFPGSAVDKVEIITNPSAKYDPEGMSGIINVIFKKEMAKGFNVKPTLSFGYGRYPKYNNSVGLNFRRNKINLTGNYSYGNNQVWYDGVNSRAYQLGDSIFYQDSNDEGYFLNKAHYGKTGIDYFLNDDNTLYLSVAGWLNDNDNFRDLHFEQVDDVGNLYFYSDRNTDEIGNRSGYEINGGWQRKFKNDDHTLDFDANLSVNEGSSDGDFQEHFFLFNGFEFLPANLQQTINDDERYVLFNRLDWVYPVKLDLAYEAGIHTTTRHTGTGLYSQTFDYNLSTYLADTNWNNRFNYDQQVVAVYNTLGQSIKKFTYKLGLRAEQTYTRSHLINTGETFNVNYLSLFPTAHFTYKFQRSESMQLSYSRRINRPELEVLNPFPSLSDPYTVMAGNPFLEPEFVHVMEASYVKYEDKYTFNASLFFRRITNLMRRQLSLNDLGQSVVTFENFAAGDLSGGEVIFGYNPYSWWRMNATLNAWQSVINDSELDQNLNFNNYGWNIHLTSTHIIKKTWFIQFSGRYNSRMELLQGTMLPMGGIDLAFNKSFDDKNGNINLRIGDVLGTRQFRFEGGDLSSSEYTTVRRWESQAAYLSISYTFGRMGDGPNRRKLKDEDNADDFSTPDLQ